MKESPYWNPRHETMPRDQLEALQVRKLRNLVQWADEQVPWQSKRLRDAGVTADQIDSIDDLRRIPLMTREEWMEGQLEHPPYGPILAAPAEAAIRYHMTSGTTGATPIRVLDSMKDWEWIAEMWCYGLWGSVFGPPTPSSWPSGTRRSSGSGVSTTHARRSDASRCPAGP